MISIRVKDGSGQDGGGLSDEVITGAMNAILEEPGSPFEHTIYSPNPLEEATEFLIPSPLTFAFIKEKERTHVSHMPSITPDWTCAMWKKQMEEIGAFLRYSMCTPPGRNSTIGRELPRIVFKRVWNPACAITEADIAPMAMYKQMRKDARRYFPEVANEELAKIADVRERALQVDKAVHPLMPVLNNEATGLTLKDYAIQFVHELLHIKFPLFKSLHSSAMVQSVKDILSAASPDPVTAFQTKIIGIPVQTLAELKKLLKYTGDMDDVALNAAIKNFLAALDQLGQDIVQAIVTFMAGSSYLPVGAELYVHFTIPSTTNAEHWPTSRTCSNKLYIHDVPSSEMARRISRAVKEGLGYGLA